MTDDFGVKRLAQTGRGFRVAARVHGQMFSQHSWESFEDVERKVRSDISRLKEFQDFK